MAFAANGERLAAAGVDGAVRVWRLTPSNGLPDVFRKDLRRIRAVAFAPGMGVASGSEDRTIGLWSINRRDSGMRVLFEHDADVYALAFSSDGARLASGSVDSTVRLWDLQQPGSQSAMLTGHLGAHVYAVSFSRDGRYLASGGTGETVRVWPLWSAAADAVCGRVWRNLSAEEWRRFLGPAVPYKPTCPELGHPVQGRDE